MTSIEKVVVHKMARFLIVMLSFIYRLNCWLGITSDPQKASI